MDKNPSKEKVAAAAKWSLITQFLAKAITPITNMILARLLLPEAFGVIATISMIVSFVEVFADAGFQKYIIQKEFDNEIEKFKTVNVAFWSNFTLAFVLWGIIAIYSEEISRAVGNPGLGFVIIISCMQIPLTAFSSIQMSLFKRNFDFKTLFYVKIISVLIPLFVTIPLAYLGWSYWSLIIGLIMMQLFNAIILTIKSPWKPSFYYSFSVLKEMLSFSIWSLVEGIAIWLTVWIDVFIIGYYLNEYYLGIYKNSTLIVAGLFSIITAAIIPVLFSTLSRVKENQTYFKGIYFKFQRFVGYSVLPLGILVYLFDDLITKIMLGEQWGDASTVVGIWALTSSFMVIYGNMASEVYRSKGNPRLSFFAQIIHLIFLVPTCIIAGKFGFIILVFCRAIIRFQFVLTHLLIMQYYMKISIFETLKNTYSFLISSLCMLITGFILKMSDIMHDVFAMIVCLFIYIIILLLFSRFKLDLINVYQAYISKNKREGF